MVKEMKRNPPEFSPIFRKKKIQNEQVEIGDVSGTPRTKFKFAQSLGSKLGVS
jgi:hypothetical protein